MSKPPEFYVKLSDTLTLSEYTSPKNGSFGFWLYDKTQGMNLAMRKKTERESFVEALNYYQGRLAKTEKDYSELRKKVDAFVSTLADNDTDYDDIDL